MNKRQRKKQYHKTVWASFTYWLERVEPRAPSDCGFGFPGRSLGADVRRLLRRMPKYGFRILPRTWGLTVLPRLRLDSVVSGAPEVP